MTDTEQLETRLTELESRFAFQQEANDSLSDMVSKQWREIDRLTKLVKRLDGQLFDLEQNIGGPAGDKPPPHY